MRKLIIFFLVTTLLAATPAFAAKVSAVTGILPVKYFVEQIGGELVEVTALVEPGDDPHTYEPKPSQMRAIAKSDAFLSIGVEFEKNWIPRFKSANKELRVFRLDRGIKKIPMVAHSHGHEGEHHHEHGEEHHDHGEKHDHAAEEHKHDEEHHDHGEEYHDHAGEHDGHHHDHGDGMDPHIWTSPLLVKQIAANILTALVKVDPDHKQIYQTNYDAFIKRVEALNQELKETLGGMPEHAEFMVYHPAWGYFAREYHLEQVPVELEGKAPGPKQLAGLIEHAREHHIKVVFVQPQFSKRAAETIATAIDGQVVEADPLAYDWFDNLRKVGFAFRSALGK